MKKSFLKTATAFVLCCLTALAGVLSCAAAEYSVAQIDDMTISLPDDMIAVTRDSQSTDKYFSLFGLDYDTTMKTFESSDIYLQGMDSESALTLTVTMTESESSEKVGDYASLTSDELANVRTSFLDTETYGSCTDLKTDKNIWLVFDVTSDGAKSLLANTVYDGMTVIITMMRTEGDVTSDDAAAFSQIVSSVTFSDLPISKSLLPYVLVGGGVIIIALAVLIVVLAVRIRKHKKARRNNAIIEELASKYTREPSGGNAEYDDAYAGAYDGREAAGDEYYDEYYNDREQPAEKSGRRYAPEPIIENFDEPDEITASYRNIDSGRGYADEAYANDSEIDEILNSVRTHRAQSEENSLYTAGYGQNEPDSSDETDGYEKKNITEDGTFNDEEIPAPQAQPTEEVSSEAYEARRQKPDEETAEGPTLVIPEPDYDLFKTGELDDIDLEENAQTDAEQSGEESEAPNGRKTKIEEKVDGAADIIFGSTDPADESADEVGDEDLVRREIEKNKFNSGYDYFDEAPKKSAGVIMTADLADFADAEDVDVIDEVERKAEQVKRSDYGTDGEPEETDGQSAGEKLKKAGKAVGGALVTFGKGVKSFGIHCGYFCQNVSRMIKRKRQAAKRKKKEEARKEREQIRAQRRAARSQEAQDGELVQLHRQSSRPSSGGYPAGRNKRK